MKASLKRLFWAAALVLVAVSYLQARSHTSDFLLPDAADIMRRPPAGSSPLVSYSFDDGMGGPDPMGWTSVDFTEQEGVYFHVDDFAGLGGGSFGGLTPLRGARSLWCGARSGPGFCRYALLPGYGYGWDQQFVSIPFAVSGDVTISFLARFDSEVGYDTTRLEYLNASGTWVTLGTFDEGVAYGSPLDSLVSATIPASGHAGSVQIRLRFKSDSEWDDEDGIYDTDGAVIVDSLVVSDDGGVVDYQDFETEAVGELSTADGNWIAAAGAIPFGDYAGLFNGSTVLQEDTTTNNTYLWGFFKDSPDTYACGGFPAQLVPPDEMVLGGEIRKMENFIVSPAIELGVNAGCAAGSLAVYVVWDAYKDFQVGGFPFSTYFRHLLQVRSFVDDCWLEWQFWNTPVTNGFGEWEHASFEVASIIAPGAEKIQLALGLIDFSGGNTCQSHAPLIDNVALYAVCNGDTIVSGAPKGATPKGYALDQNHPNPFNPTTVIRYDIPPPGTDVTLRIYDVSGRLVRTLVDGPVEPASHVVAWDGTNEQGGRVASGVYFYRLQTRAFTRTRKMVLLE